MCLIFQVVLLILNLPYLGVISVVLWLGMFGWVDYCVYKEVLSPERGLLVFCHIALVQWSLIMLKYDGWIGIHWGFILILFFLPFVLALIVLYIIGLPFLRNQDPFPVFQIYDDDEE